MSVSCDSLCLIPFVSVSLEIAQMGILVAPNDVLPCLRIVFRGTVIAYSR